MPTKGLFTLYYRGRIFVARIRTPSSPRLASPILWHTPFAGATLPHIPNPRILLDAARENVNRNTLMLRIAGVTDANDFFDFTENPHHPLFRAYASIRTGS